MAKRGEIRKWGKGWRRYNGKRWVKYVPADETPEKKEKKKASTETEELVVEKVEKSPFWEGIEPTPVTTDKEKDEKTEKPKVYPAIKYANPHEGKSVYLQELFSIKAKRLKGLIR